MESGSINLKYNLKKEEKIHSSGLIAKAQREQKAALWCGEP